MQIDSLSPTGSTANLGVTSSSQPLTLPAFGEDSNIVLVNVGTQVVFVTLGGPGVTTSTTTGHPILPNTDKNFAVGMATTTVAAVAASSGSTLYATAGSGRP